MKNLTKWTMVTAEVSIGAQESIENQAGKSSFKKL